MRPKSDTSWPEGKVLSQTKICFTRSWLYQKMAKIRLSGTKCTSKLPEENVVKGETGTISNVFQILQDLHLKQYQETGSNQPKASHTSTTNTACTTTQLMPLTTYSSTPASHNTGMATPITGMSELSTVSRTTMPADTTPSSRQPTSEIHQNSSHSGPPICCMHVHQPQSQACKPGEPPALRKVKIPHNDKTL